MFLNPDAPTPGVRHRLCAGLPAALAGMGAALLVACSTSPSRQAADSMSMASRANTNGNAGSNGPSPVMAAAPRRNTTQGTQNTQSPASSNLAALSASDAVTALLAYADRVRLMSPAELGPEATRLGEAPIPYSQLQLAMVLGQWRQLPESVRAQDLLARVLGNPDADAQLLHPLARLLAARYAEQRRLEEQLERQTQQTREVQRRLDQTSERLEALKAIERSLTSRNPPAASPSPGSPAAPAPSGRHRPAPP